MHVEFRGELRGRGHKFRTRSDNQQTSIDTVRSLLDDIVARQLVADVPRCVLLSGELDSSVITTLTAAQLGEHGERVRSFAVGFAGQTETFTPDDMRATPYAHEVATQVGSHHQDIVLDHTTLADAPMGTIWSSSAMGDQGWDVEPLEVFSEVGLGECLDAVQRALQSDLHAPEPERVAKALRDRGVRSVGAVEGLAQVLVELRAISGNAGAEEVECLDRGAAGIGRPAPYPRRNAAY